MSDHFLILIPTDPDMDISEEALEAACDALEVAFPEAEDVSYDIFDEVRFIDPGVAFDSVHCPACGKDAEAWWPAAMDKAARLEFDDLTTTTKCCKTVISLNDMSYSPAAGFARWALVVVNCGMEALSGTARDAVEAALGASVRVVIQKG